MIRQAPTFEYTARTHLVICTLALTLFWFSYALNVFLRQGYWASSAEAHRPILLNGLLLRLDRNLEPALIVGDHRSRYLVLVTSDNCRYSVAEVETWRKSIRHVPLGTYDQVLLISLDGNRVSAAIREILEERRIAHQSTMVKRRTVFLEETGVSTTPQLLALDDSLHVRVVANSLEGTALTLVGRFFDRVQMK